MVEVPDSVTDEQIKEINQEIARQKSSGTKLSNEEIIRRVSVPGGTSPRPSTTTTQQTQYIGGVPVEMPATTEASKKRAQELVKRIRERQESTGIKKLDKEIVPLTYTDSSPKLSGKATSTIPYSKEYYEAIGYGEAEMIEMKRFGKSFIPGWLTAEDWKYMSPLERAASIAGDVGSVILIVLSGRGAIKSIASRRPIKSLKGTVPKDYPGIKYYTSDDLQQAIRDFNIPGKQKTALLKNTVPIKEPVKAPVDVTVVKEGPVGVKYLQGTYEINIKPQKPYSSGSGKPSGGLPTKGGTAGTRAPSTATMTIDQMLRQLGITNFNVTIPPIITIPKTEKGKKAKPVVMPTETPKPSTIEEPDTKTQIKTRPTEEPDTKTEPAIVTKIKTVSPGITETPKTSTPGEGETETPSPVPQPVPSPIPQPKPSPTPTAEETAKPPRTPKIKPVKPIPRFGTGEDKKSDEEKRQAIKDAGGAVAWPQGELRGKTVWHVILAPFDKPRHLIVLGKQPEGAENYPGPGQAYKSIKTLFGKGPDKPVKLEGGIADPVITSENGHAKITFAHDKTASRLRHPKTKTYPSSFAPDIVITKRGGKKRRHLRTH